MVSGGLMVVSVALIVVIRLCMSTDSGEVETASSPPHVRRERRVNCLVLAIGVGGFWLLLLSAVLHLIMG